MLPGVTEVLVGVTAWEKLKTVRNTGSCRVPEGLVAAAKKE